MLDKETKERLADYFTAAELVELLGVDVRLIVDAFEEEIEEALDDLEDIMEVKR
jgi:hypothetical protein